MDLINRTKSRWNVALETTLLVHGVPRESARPLADELKTIVLEEGAEPLLVGVVRGRAIVGMTDEELERMLGAPEVPKANTANLGVLAHRGMDAATTVSATMELASAAGVRVFATGGIGGVHRGYGTTLDISSDLAALARFPVAVVCSGVKSLLDVESTREALETLGVPVVGFGTDVFPAFYVRESDAGVDARFDSAGELAAFVGSELARTGQGIIVANPIPEPFALRRERVEGWVREAEFRTSAPGRDRTPAILAMMHELSGGQTLAANIELAKSNARLASRVAAALTDD